MRKKTIWLLAGMTFVPSVHGYDVITHSGISEHAMRQSALNESTSGILAALCEAENVDDRRCVLPSSSPYPNTLTPMRLVAEGSVREDDDERAVNHFFDPQNAGGPLTYPFGFKRGDASPDWALEDRFEIDRQSASLSDARNRLHEALTGPSSIERQRALGATFEALGHVVHHVQDMAQPQHVRNDVHCDRFFSTWLSPFPVPGICFVSLAYRPSAYEGYTKSRGLDLPLTGYEHADYASFEQPREFWSDSGRGMADFATNNFVSIGTNFYMEQGFVVAEDDHPRPTGAGADLVKRQITDSDLLGPRGPNQPLSGEIWFVGTRVVDQYRESETLNQRSSTFSIFDSDLEEAGQRLVFTLNRFNYRAANDFLLPRAAAYSTGLINYFFRGRIEIGLPAEGIYGILDHATTNAAGQGFDKLKLELRNASPDGVKPSGEEVPQTMQGGTLVAVAKYTLNSCYQPDLSGDFAVDIESGFVVYPAGCTLDQYFAGEEQISQSAAILAASLDKTAADFTFDFSSQPIPVNARDLRIQVVYTGQLGAEEDGIAFGGRDISEPTHLMVYNNSDYYLVDGKFYTPQEIRSTPALADRVKGLNIDPSPLTGVTVSTVSGVPITDPSGAVAANGYVRVAVLADTDAPFALGVKSTFQSGGTAASTLSVWANETVLRGEPAFITPLAIYRGPRTHFVHVVFKANNNAPMDDSELVTMSSRTVPDPGPTPIPLKF